MSRSGGWARASSALILGALLCGAAPAGVRAPRATVTLGSLEPKIALAPGILADELTVEAAMQDVNATRAKIGLQYTYDNSLGPTAVIVPRSYDYHVLRYQQNLGVLLPLFGSNLAEQLEVLDAQKQQQFDVIALAEARRERLSALRAAYVAYWEYDTEGSISESYLHTAKAAIPQGRVLLRTGFWTQAKLLDLLDAIDRVTTDDENDRSSQMGQLALIEEAVGAQMAPFASDRPAFFAACVPERSVAIDSAFRVDAMLAELEAESGVIRAEITHVRFSSVQANATLSAGSATDINQQVSGYDLQAAVSLAAPRHGRAEERYLRSSYDAQLQSLGLQEDERRNALTAAVDADLVNVQNARATLNQALEDLATSTGNLQKALVRYRTIHQGAGVGFSDVQERGEEVYAAQIAAASAQAEILLEANQLLLLAPDTCTGGPATP